MENPYEPPKTDRPLAKRDDRTPVQKFASGCALFFMVVIVVAMALAILMFAVCAVRLGVEGVPTLLRQ